MTKNYSSHFCKAKTQRSLTLMNTSHSSSQLLFADVASHLRVEITRHFRLLSVGKRDGFHPLLLPPIQ